MVQIGRAARRVSPSALALPRSAASRVWWLVATCVAASLTSFGCSLRDSDYAPERWPGPEAPTSNHEPPPPASPAVPPSPSGAATSGRDGVIRPPSALAPSPAAAAADPAPTATPHDASTPAVATASGLLLGYNLDFPGDWTHAPPFIDQMRNARVLRGTCASNDPDCDTEAHLDLDAQGWVRSLTYRDDPTRAYRRVTTEFNTSTERADIGATFVVTWTGSGDVHVLNGSDVVRDLAARRITFRLPEGLTMIAIDDIDPSDYVRDLRIFRADHEALLAAGEVFHPDWLEFLAPFRSLRFVDWMHANERGECSGGTQHGRSCYAATDDACAGGGVCRMPGHWELRSTPDQFSWSSLGQYFDPARPELGTKLDGYPLEVLVALANRLAAHPHFNMPANADDDYVTRFAEYVRDHLKPDLVATVEYSNQIWNPGLPQAAYAAARGSSLLPGVEHAALEFAAGRTSQICQIWKQVFADQGARVRCLLAVPSDDPESSRVLLDCPAWVEAHAGTAACYETVDALGVTGFFSGCLPDHADTLASWLADDPTLALTQAAEQLQHGSAIGGCSDSLDDAVARYARFAELARSRGLELYAYAGGSRAAYDGAGAVRQLLVDLAHDARMYDAYTRNFASFAAAGGRVFHVAGWIAPNDAESHADSVVDREHPKYRAIVDFAAAPPPASP